MAVGTAPNHTEADTMMWRSAWRCVDPSVNLTMPNLSKPLALMTLISLKYVDAYVDDFDENARGKMIWFLKGKKKSKLGCSSAQVGAQHVLQQVATEGGARCCKQKYDRTWVI